MGAPGSRPLFTAERVTADVAYRTLRSEVLIVRSLVVVAPRLDLGAPFPELPPEEGPAAAPGFEVRRLTLRRGVVLGAAPTGAAAQWVRSWDIGDVEGRGSFVAGLWDLKLDAGRARIDRPGFEPMVLDLGGRARYR